MYLDKKNINSYYYYNYIIFCIYIKIFPFLLCLYIIDLSMGIMVISIAIQNRLLVERANSTRRKTGAK